MLVPSLFFLSKVWGMTLNDVTEWLFIFYKVIFSSFTVHLLSWIIRRLYNYVCNSIVFHYRFLFRRCTIETEFSSHVTNIHGSICNYNCRIWRIQLVLLSHLFKRVIWDRMFRIKTLEFDNRPLFPPTGHKPFTDGSICNYNCTDLKNTTHSSVSPIQTCYLKPIVSRTKLPVHYFLS
mgnify:CR=1 FL=1